MRVLTVVFPVVTGVSGVCVDWISYFSPMWNRQLLLKAAILFLNKALFCEKGDREATDKAADSLHYKRGGIMGRLKNRLQVCLVITQAYWNLLIVEAKCWRWTILISDPQKRLVADQLNKTARKQVYLQKARINHWTTTCTNSYRVTFSDEFGWQPGEKISPLQASVTDFPLHNSAVYRRKPPPFTDCFFVSAAFIT